MVSYPKIPGSDPGDAGGQATKEVKPPKKPLIYYYGTANDDTLLYGVEVKFYNMEVQLDKNLQTCHPGLFVIGDGSGVYVAHYIAENA